MGQVVIRPGERFLPGVVVSAYPKSNWPFSQLPPVGAPQGAAAGSGTVAADGLLTIADLAEDTAFFLHAATPDRYTSVTSKTAVDVEQSTGQGKDLKFAAITAAALGDNTAVAAVAGKRIKVSSYVLIASGAVSVKWKSGAATDLSGAMAFAANGGLAPPAEPSAHVMQTAQGQALVLNLSAAVSVGGHLSYFLEA